MADSGAVHDSEAEAPGGLAPQVLRAAGPLDEWDRFVDSSPQGCVFCRPWWLEAVAPGQFEVLTLRRGGSIVAGMPLVRYRRWGLQAIHMPELTQTLGPLLAPPAAESYEKRLSAEMELLSALVAAMPKVSHVNFFCHPGLTNWLPFYWAGYEQTTRYTYAIEDLSDPDRAFANFAHMKRKNIKKAEKLVEVREDMEPRAFYDHHAASLRKQGETIFYSYELFERIHRAATERGAGKTWLAVDPSGNVHSAIFVVFDPASAYYLISTIDPEFRSSDSATLLVKRAIEYVAPRTKRFDFEGSMVQGVEASFRKFGAVQRPYFHIHRNDLPLPVRLALAIAREVARNFRRRGR